MLSDKHHMICRKFGISAACLYHGNPKNYRILAQLQNGNIQALFVSPERLANHKLKAALQKIIIHMITIDEVHCLIEWGSEFRPTYQNIGKFIRKLQHRPVIAAFSATIPPNDIPFLASSLNMNEYRVHSGKRKRTKSGKFFLDTTYHSDTDMEKYISPAFSKHGMVIYLYQQRRSKDKTEKNLSFSIRFRLNPSSLIGGKYQRSISGRGKAAYELKGKDG